MISIIAVIIYKSFYFFLETYVHVNIKGSNAILYNTLSEKIIEINSNPTIVGLLEKLTDKNNLYVFELTEKEFNNTIISNFIYKVNLKENSIELPSEIKKQLKDYYEPYDRRLEEWLGRRLPWRT